MKILVCGSRTFDNRLALDTVLNGFWWPTDASRREALTIISGGAAGADAMAERWADAHVGVAFRKFSADWKLHGKAAGPIRNQLMLEESEPHLVIAFVNKPLERSKGTADMVRRARQTHRPVWVVEAR